MLKNEMESFVRIWGEGIETSYVPLHEGKGVNNCQIHPYVNGPTGKGYLKTES
jgi:hypothetical protein